MEIVLWIIALVGGLAIGAIVAYYFLSKKSDTKAAQIVQEAEERAQAIKKTRELEAKEKFYQLKNEFEQETKGQKREIEEKENELRKKEQSLSDKYSNADRK